MRRGLLAWDSRETPKAALESRVERVQVAMRAEGYDALLAYTNFPRPAAVSYLTHFIPYWNQGLMVMGQDGLPTLLVALSNRVRGWALETCHVEDVICTPRIGAEAAKVVAGFADTIGRVGVVDADRLPRGLADPFRANLKNVALDDATDLYTAARAPADAPEIALTRRAAAIADAAIDEARTGGFDRAAPLIAAVEGTARRAAAEEVQIAIAPDLAQDTTFRRLEGDAVLGSCHAVRATVAYKGFWVRRTVTLSQGGEMSAAMSANWADAAARFRAAAAGLGTGAAAATAIDGGFKHWSLTGPFGGNPLADLADSVSAYRRIGAGSIVNLAVHMETADGPWLGSGPVLLAAGSDDAAQPLFA